MFWKERFNAELKPTDDQILEFVETPLWADLTAYLQKTYNIFPTLFYSGCSMDNGIWEGWNIKYKKSGKSLCTLYPKKGYFTALVTIGAKEAADADVLIPLCDNYTQELYRQTKAGKNGKSLGIVVTNESILNDVKDLVGLRAGR